MRKHVLIVALVAVGFAVEAPLAAAADENASLEALKQLNEFIGSWKGSGAPVKARPAISEVWSENVEWGWRFKGDDAWLTFQVKNGKHLKSGELRYLDDKERFQLTLTLKDGKKQVFEGQLKNSYLVLEQIDGKDETRRLTMNTAGDGARFVYLVERKPKGRTLYVKDFQVAFTKEGESLGKAASQTVCVVSGGLGTMPVSYKGETFYVCCSGCRDAFNENPEKYVKEFKAKKGKK